MNMMPSFLVTGEGGAIGPWMAANNGVGGCRWVGGDTHRSLRQHAHGSPYCCSLLNYGAV